MTTFQHLKDGAYFTFAPTNGQTILGVVMGPYRKINRLGYEFSTPGGFVAVKIRATSTEVFPVSPPKEWSSTSEYGDRMHPFKIR